jgi:hypothetical protein
LYDDWETDGCNVRPATDPDTGLGFTISTELGKDIGIRLKNLYHDDTYDPLFPESYKGGLHPGMLVVSVDGHVFKTLHPDTDRQGGANDKLPTEIINAMHNGQRMRLEWRGKTEMFVRDQSLKGFGEAADACRRLMEEDPRERSFPPLIIDAAPK